MKNLIPFLLLLIAINSLAQTDTLKLSNDVWPPFTNVEGKKSISFEIVQKTLERIDVASTYEITNFDETLKNINTGTYDGFAALWKSEERENNFLFSDPYMENQLILVGRKGANVSFLSFSELKEYRIGLVEGYAYDDSIKSLSNLNITYGKSDQENLENLISHQIDYMLVDGLLMQYLFEHEINDVSALLEFAPTPFISKPLYFAIRKSTPNAEEILSSFNQEFKKLIAEGVYNEILGLNWISADVNGDGTLELIHNGKDAGKDAPVSHYTPNPSDSLTTQGYYINNTLYDTWNDVPQEYKNTAVEKNIPINPDNYGMTLNF